MPLYRLEKHVVQNILSIIDNTDVKGSQVSAIVEMKMALAAPVAEPETPETPPPAEK